MIKHHNTILPVDQVTSPATALVVVPPGIAPNVELDLIALKIIALKRISKSRYIGDWLRIFEREAESMLKRWGTFLPAQQMHIVEADGSKRPINMWFNPNFRNECTHAGMGTDGFRCSFSLPSGQQVNVHYWAHDHSLNFEVGND